MKECSSSSTVKYRIYLLPRADCSAETEEQRIENLSVKLLNATSSRVSEFLWFNETFRITGVRSNHLFGSCDFGDSISDEWFIVRLLLDFTAACPDVAVQISDDDGEFLLIEGADFLPEWLEDAEDEENRVWICGGRLCLIPPSVHSASIESTGVALKLLKKQLDCCQVDAELQACINERATVAATEQRTHSLMCFLPHNLFHCLTEMPEAVSAAANTYLDADPDLMKMCHQQMTHFRPGSRALCRVTMTRIHYAKLTQAKPLQNRLWSLPVARDKNRPLTRAYDIGLKLSFGCEMLCLLAERRRKPSSDQSETTEKLLSEKRLSALNEMRYFGDLISGSKEYAEKLSAAEKFFNASEDDFIGSKLLDRSRYYEKAKDVESLRKAEAEIPLDDDDAWMSISPDQLQQMFDLAQKQRKVKDNIQLIDQFLSRESEISGLSGSCLGAKVNINLNAGVDFGAVDEDAFEKLVNMNSDDSSADSDLEAYSNDREGLTKDELQGMEKELKAAASIVSASHPTGEGDASSSSMVTEALRNSLRNQFAACGPAANILSREGGRLPSDVLIRHIDDDEL